MSLKEQIDQTNIPKHIAVIMDGNGRWAKQQSAPSRIFGHRNGVRAVRSTTEACRELGVTHLTLYAFSTENWNRPKLEVSALMELLVQTIKSEIDQLIENDIKLNVIGDLTALPKRAQKNLQAAIDKSSHCTKMVLTLALSYSSRWELTEAIKQIAKDSASGSLLAENINPELVSSYLATRDLPDPELLIRTSGEQRISNYLLWQIAYSELYFTETLWPDFNKEELFKAVLDYQQRERRFGRISEQIQEAK